MDINDPKVKLFLQQKQLLDTFLEHKAISEAQYDTSYNGLIQKMGFSEEDVEDLIVKKNACKTLYK